MTAMTETERVPAEDPEDETGGTANLTTDARSDTADESVRISQRRAASSGVERGNSVVSASPFLKLGPFSSSPPCPKSRSPQPDTLCYHASPYEHGSDASGG